MAAIKDLIAADRGAAWGDLGIYVGTAKPSLVPYAEWLVTGVGYWGFINIAAQVQPGPDLHPAAGATQVQGGVASPAITSPAQSAIVGPPAGAMPVRPGDASPAIVGAGTFVQRNPAGAAASITGGAATVAVATPGAAEEYTCRIGPDGLIATTGIPTATLAKVQDASDAPDALWNTASVGTTATSQRVSFPTYPGVLKAGAVQKFRARVRKWGPSLNYPSARIELWENGVLKRAGEDVAITADDPGQVIEFTWAASEVTDLSNVECKVVGTPSADNTVDVGGIDWLATGDTFFDKFIGPTTAAPDPAFWELYKTAAGETWALSLAGAVGGSLLVKRTAAGASGLGSLAYARTVQAFSIVSGRSFKGNTFGINGNAMIIEGDGGHVLRFVASQQDDGENLTAQVQVMDGASGVSMFTWFNSGVAGGPTEVIEVRVVDATHVRLFVNGIESDQGAALIPTLGTQAKIGFGVAPTGTGTLTSSFEMCAVGKV